MNIKSHYTLYFSIMKPEVWVSDLAVWSRQSGTRDPHLSCISISHLSEIGKQLQIGSNISQRFIVIYCPGSDRIEQYLSGDRFASKITVTSPNRWATFDISTDLKIGLNRTFIWSLRFVATSILFLIQSFLFQRYNIM